MRKLNALKAHMSAALKHRGIEDNPSDMHFAIPNGSTLARSGVGQGFAYEYTLVMGIFDFAHSIDEIMVPLLLWVERWQPTLLALTASEGGIAWEVELLDDNKSDIMIRIPLDETVALKPRSDKGFDLVRPEEPLPYALEYGAPLHAVYLDGELIARCDAHPDQGL